MFVGFVTNIRYGVHVNMMFDVLLVMIYDAVGV